MGSHGQTDAGYHPCQECVTHKLCSVDAMDTIQQGKDTRESIQLVQFFWCQAVQMSIRIPQIVLRLHD